MTARPWTGPLTPGSSLLLRTTSVIACDCRRVTEIEACSRQGGNQISTPKVPTQGEKPDVDIRHPELRQPHVESKAVDALGNDAWHLLITLDKINPDQALNVIHVEPSSFWRHKTIKIFHWPVGNQREALGDADLQGPRCTNRFCRIEARAHYQRDLHSRSCQRCRGAPFETWRADKQPLHNTLPLEEHTCIHNITTNIQEQYAEKILCWSDVWVSSTKHECIITSGHGLIQRQGQAPNSRIITRLYALDTDRSKTLRFPTTELVNLWCQNVNASTSEQALRGAEYCSHVRSERWSPTVDQACVVHFHNLEAWSFTPANLLLVLPGLSFNKPCVPFCHILLVWRTDNDVRASSHLQTATLELQHGDVREVSSPAGQNLGVRTCILCKTAPCRKRKALWCIQQKNRWPRALRVDDKLQICICAWRNSANRDGQ
mmetsp:Transcript_46775/g.87846  ORF Transcript_46775/g.87846 Transcript_46775/m.87846 type:complete len:432 (+) Transcript_46775:112-1407(+)